MTDHSYLEGVWPPGRSGQRLLVGLGAVALLLEALSYALVPEATSFETSPVVQYPAIHWGLFIVIVVTSALVLVGDALEETGLWPYALSLSLANYGLFLFLPALRGYAFYGRGTSDALFHVGYVKGLAELGRLPAVGGEVTWYPMTHLLAGGLHLLGVGVPTVMYVVSFGATVLLVTGSGLALYALYQDRAALLVGFAVAHPLLLTTAHVGFQPQYLSMTLLPVVVACFELHRRSDTARYLPLLVPLVVCVVPFHPVTFGYLLAFLVISALFWRVADELSSGRFDRPNFWLAFMLVPVGFVWFTGFERTVAKLTTAIESVRGGGTAPVGAETAQATEAALSTVQVAVRFAQLYGATALYLLVGGVVGLAVLWRSYSRREMGVATYITAHAGAGLVAALLFLTVDLIAQDPLRIVRYLIVFTILLVGTGLLRYRRPTEARSRSLSFVLTFVVIAATVLGAGAVYVPNNHTTYSEYDGTAFVLDHHDGETPVRAFDTRSAMEMYVEGAASPSLRPYRLGAAPSDTLYPSLGYDENATAATTFGRSYLTTKAHDRQFYTADYLFPTQRRSLFLYNETHMRMIRNDSTAQKYYDNGGFEAWRVRNATTTGTRVGR